MLDDVEPDEVLIAVPSAPGSMRARVVSACRTRGVPVRTMPTVFELLQNGGRLMRQVREVRVEDVLGREPVRMEIERVGSYLSGRRVMVTGAGGSIGSELCRQIARVGPATLVLVDHAEDNLFEIQRELVDDRHVLEAVSVLADCKEEDRMREVFAAHRPDVVFHAAAYKHVGLMEANPVEAVRNNAIATRTMARVAGEAQTEAFVLVSTDKAVEPATVMGASKALAEWAVEAAGSHHPQTAYASVRFGNVLGSSGSVVPIFRRQIANGGPITVTHENMTRFFMTIPEAVQLVIRTGSLARGGDVYVLEMGEPVRIMDLAEDMIRFSGLEPGKDIAIEVIGAAPGREAARGPVQRATSSRSRRPPRRSCAPSASPPIRNGSSARSSASRGSSRPATRPRSPPRSPSSRASARGPICSLRPFQRWRSNLTAARLRNISAAAQCSSSSRSRFRARSRSTVPTSASRRSSALPCSPFSTSRKRGKCAACVIGPAVHPSAIAISSSA